MRILAFVLFIIVTTPTFTQQPFINPDFGKQGRTRVNFYEKPAEIYNIYSLGVNDSDQVMLAGNINHEAVVQRINKNGHDDPSFGYRGFRFFDFGLESENYIKDIVKYPGGKTLLIGDIAPSTSFINRYYTAKNVCVIRLMPDGQPDPSFGIGGKAMYIKRYYAFQGMTGLVLPDGKIMVACRSEEPDRIALVRFNADGTVDSSFGTDGSSTINGYSGGNTLNYRDGRTSFIRQPDGKLLLGDLATETIFLNGGTGTLGTSAVYRFNPDGSVDNSFGVNGRFLNRFGFDNYCINKLLLLPDGKIMVAGNTLVNQPRKTRYLLFRLLTDGQVDTVFANHGQFIGFNESWTKGTIGDIQLAGNDKMIVSAAHSEGSGSAVDLFRLNLDGSFDTSFAKPTNYFRDELPGSPIIQNARFEFDSNQDLVVLAYTPRFSPGRGTIGHMLLRVSKDGQPIKDYNGKYFRIYYNDSLKGDNDNYGSIDKLTGIIQGADGKILMAGNVYSDNETIKKAVLTRLHANGKIDSSFGNNGRRFLPDSVAKGALKNMLKLADGKILLIRNDSTLLKVDMNGEIDSTYGLKGKIALTVPLYTAIETLTEQPDKKILVLLTTYLVRLNADGSPDYSFGTNGVVTFTTTNSIKARKLKLQTDGKIMVCLENANGPQLNRYLPNGIPDLSFGEPGDGSEHVGISLSPASGTPFNTYFNDLLLMPDGRYTVICLEDKVLGIDNVNNDPIIAAGANYRDIILFGFTPEGHIDTSFGGYETPGFLYKGTTHLSPPFAEEFPGEAMVTPQGKILIAGYFNRGTGWDIGLVQLSNNGNYDTTCTLAGMATAGEDDILQHRFWGGNQPLKMIRAADSSYLIAGTRMGQGADFFAINFFSPTAPRADYSSFIASRDTSCFGVNLSWQTSFECGLDSFYVEYSKDNVSYSKLASVPGKGNTLNEYGYFQVAASYGDNYYRVRTGTGGSLYGASSLQKITIENRKPGNISWRETQMVRNDSLFDVTLHWSTLNENGARSFEIALSTDSVDWQTVQTLPAAGTVNGQQDYQYLFTNLRKGKYYVRLHLTANQCRDEYSETSFKLELPPSILRFAVYPNPVDNELTVQLATGEKGDITITNIFGQLLKVIRNPQTPAITINCSALPPGLYFLQFTGEKHYTARFIKVR